MQESQVNATSAALSLLGYKGESKLIINTVNPNSFAFKQLLTGDQIISLDQKVLTSATQITDYLDSKKAGDIVKVKVIRSSAGSTPIEIPVKLSKRDDGSAFIGVNIETKYNFPVNVKIKLDETGGPSGGGRLRGRKACGPDGCGAE